MADRHQNDDESMGIGWISISDLLMLGAFSLLIVSQGLSVQSGTKSDQIDQLKKELIACTTAQESSLRKLEDSSRNLKLTESQLREQQAINEGLLKDINYAQDRESEIRKKLDAQVAVSQSLGQELASAKGLIKSHLHEIDQLNDSLKREKLSVVAARQRCDRLGKYLQELNQELEERKEELRLANIDLGTLRSKIVGLTDQVEETEIRERGFRQELLGIRARNNRLGRVVFVVDRSGSMGDPTNSGDLSRWAYVRSVIATWLQKLPFEEARLILFNDRVEAFPQTKDFLSLAGDAESRSESIKSMVDVLFKTEPLNGTGTLDALAAAYKLDNVDAIFLFTDGQPTNKPNSEMTSSDIKNLQDQVLNLVRSKSQGERRVPINVIGLGDYFSDRSTRSAPVHLPFGEFLVRIAKESGGAFLGR